MIKIYNPQGKVILTNDYFAGLVGNAITSCYGVAGMSVAGAKDGVRAVLFGNDIPEKGVVVKEDESEFFKKEILDKYNFKNVKIAYGGKERQDSVYNGLKLLDEKCDVVLIHDGARPFVSDKIIDKSIEEAKEHKAIVVGVPVKDTIKVIDNDKNIVDTPNRSVLWAVQTPQTFDYNILIDAYKDAFKNKFYGTDDAMLVERIGYKVKMLEGSYNNIKITTQEDLNIGSQILRVQD